MLADAVDRVLTVGAAGSLTCWKRSGAVPLDCERAAVLSVACRVCSHSFLPVSTSRVEDLIRAACKAKATDIAAQAGVEEGKLVADLTSKIDPSLR